MPSRRSKEPSPPRVVTLPEFLSYSKDILESMSRTARGLEQLQFARLLDIAAAEAARIAAGHTEPRD